VKLKTKAAKTGSSSSTRKDLLARVGGFSSDRAVQECAQKIWNVSPLSALQRGERIDLT